MHKCQQLFQWRRKSTLRNTWGLVSGAATSQFLLLLHSEFVLACDIQTKNGHHESCLQVVSEYRKARTIMADVTVEGATEGVWHNLFLEVDKVASHKHTHRHMKLILI